MEWFFVLIMIAVIAVGALAATGRLGGMPNKVDDRPGPDLPEGALDGDDLRDVRFAVVTRGYQMQQVDAVLDRIASQLESGTERSKSADDKGGSSYWKWSDDPREWQQTVHNT